MKRAIGRGLLAVLVCEILLESSILILDGGIEAYIAEYSTIDSSGLIYKALMMAGVFLVGAVNEELGVSIWWLVLGLVLLPFVDYLGLLFVGLLGVGGLPPQAWVVVVPVLTTVAALLPTVTVWAFQVSRSEQ